MAEAAGSREQPAAGRAPPDAAHRAEEEPEPASLDAPAAAAGRRRERRSGVSAVGAAERFPGGSLGPAAAPDTDACLLEAAKATPRRSSIIKVRARRPGREVSAGPAAAGLPGLKPPSGAPLPAGRLGPAGVGAGVGRGVVGARRGGAARTLRAGEAAALPAPNKGGGAAAQPPRSPPWEGASLGRAAAGGDVLGGPGRPVPGEWAPELVCGGVLLQPAAERCRDPARTRACPVNFAAGQLPHGVVKFLCSS